MQKLFSHDKFKDYLVFKGRTCLSKAYGAINRFSEDVDITIYPKTLGDLGESFKIRKIKSRDRKAVRKFVEDEICSFLKEALDEDIGSQNYKLFFDEEDVNNVTLLFQFPSQASYPPYPVPFIPGDSYSYIKPEIKLEFGSLGGTWPSQKKTVKSYAKDIMDDYFDEFEVNTMSIKRNLIEKLSILHSIVFRPADKLVNKGYSRHYYDIYAIMKGGINIDTNQDLEILKAVIENNEKFWSDSWVNYRDIKSFKDIRLVPSKERTSEIKSDYEKMTVMFLDDFPKFDEIIEFLDEVEIGL